MIKPLGQFTIVPSLPVPLEPLREIALNLWWSWEHEAINLFRHLDAGLWEQVYHNPVHLLGIISQSQLEAAAKDEAFLAHLGVVYRKFREYLTAPSWFGGSSGGMGRGSVPETGNGNTGIFPTPPSDARCEKSDPLCIAYFSAEFGITECLPLYSGGLGLLAGDYLKSTSYLGLPFVGVGLLYQHGYFRQRLTADGWQMAEYPANDFYNMPVQLARRADGTPVRVTVDYPRGTAYAQVWRAEVGRTALYLLDTNIDENGDEVLRNITSYLYGGDLRKRIEQEMLLGIGGCRALIALGICPTVCHMNEGHSGFMAVERIRQLMAAEHLSFDEAREASSAGNIFTTHTPVPAGIDLFPSDLVDNYLNGYYDALGISRDEFLALGRENPSDRESPFSMPILAFRLSATSNGVSRMHGDVSRRMWKNLWPNVPVDEVPIGSITNGIHIRSWVSNDMQSLFDRYLGPGWIQNLVDDQSTWTQIDQIPEVELWRTHERRRERLVAFARQRLKEQRMRVGASPAEIAATDEILDPSAITIGFARRFVTYKRAALLFHQPDRLAQLINQPERPVQFIFAGKAHPDDHEGKELIQKICKFIAQERFRYRIIFIEDYDICVARYLVQGVDVWLNTPMPPSEASGTSGMKVAANGGLNFSILDGWWAEAYPEGGGWTIGRGEVYEDGEYQNEVEAKAIYNILEKEIIPLFYDRTRGRDGIPRGWVNQMKLAMRNLAPVFNTKRMVSEYAEQLYFPTHQRWCRLNQDSAERAKGLAHWRTRLRGQWSEIRIERVDSPSAYAFEGDADLPIKAYVHLGALSPDDVSVQIYHGLLNSEKEIVVEDAPPMDCAGQMGDGTYLFEGFISSIHTGLHGYTVRVLPQHEDLSQPYEPGLIVWAS